MRRYRFHLRPSLSPTYDNIRRYLTEKGWAPTRFPMLAHFGEKNFQYDIPTTECLEFKHLLAQLVTRYCPQTMPETHSIDDQNWPNIIAGLTQQQNKIWILKPALLNNGQHIKIFRHINDVEAHYSHAHRLGGKHVLQQYVSQPHLLREHKYSIRMFVIMTNDAGVYLYPKGYLNVALRPYQKDNITDLRSHLTNEHLQEHETNVIQIPTERMDSFAASYEQIQAIVAAIITALQKQHPKAFQKQQHRTLAIFGFDFLVDDTQRVWLLEVNHGPCFPVDDEHPLQRYLYHSFWHAFLSGFVFSISHPKPQEKIQRAGFECITHTAHAIV